jgi:hypothetical protein
LAFAAVRKSGVGTERRSVRLIFTAGIGGAADLVLARAKSARVTQSLTIFPSLSVN